MAYTIIKDRKQVEHNFVSIIRARARCALPMPMEFHPVAWLHIPINPETGAALSFADWNAEVVLRVLATIVQRLGAEKEVRNPLNYDIPMYATHREFTATGPALAHTQLASCRQRRAGQSLN